MKRLKYLIYVTASIIVMAIAMPALFPLTGEQFFTSDYRLPYNLGEDYFLYKKYAGSVAGYNTIPVIGDSVIWGHYTSDTDTLTAHLNRRQDIADFSNMGIDGIHPAVMYGLAENYCRALTNKKIIIGINLLWMSSPRHDLTGGKNSEINHRGLLPQFTEIIPAYNPSFEERLSFVIKRNTSFFLWIDHLRLTKFRGKNLYRWCMDNPGKNTLQFFNPVTRIYELPEPMDASKFPLQDPQWVKTEQSLQWRYTLKTLKLLKEQDNDILAIITPFNRYMLTEESANQNELIINAIKDNLASEGITAIIPEIPPKEEFADSSHPTGKGYRTIAENLLENSEFKKFIKP
jgi:hypothetical protein